MGRPTKYRGKYLKSAEKYLKDCCAKQKIPFIQELSMQLGVNDDTLNEWCKAREDFSATIKRVKDYQKMRLMDDGLAGKVSSTMAIFLLKANHNMIETDRLQHTGDETEPLTIIFTDSATWKRSEENRKKLEHTNGVVKDPVQPKKTVEVRGGYDWTGYSGMGNSG